MQRSDIVPFASTPELGSCSSTPAEQELEQCDDDGDGGDTHWKCGWCDLGITKQEASSYTSQNLRKARFAHREHAHPEVGIKEWNGRCKSFFYSRAECTVVRRRSRINKLVTRNLLDMVMGARCEDPHSPTRLLVPIYQPSRGNKHTIRNVYVCLKCGLTAGKAAQFGGGCGAHRQEESDRQRCVRRDFLADAKNGLKNIKGDIPGYTESELRGMYVMAVDTLTKASNGGR
jgi:hypothetical protein